MNPAGFFTSTSSSGCPPASMTSPRPNGGCTARSASDRRRPRGSRSPSSRRAVVVAAVALIIAASPRCFSSSGPTLSPSPNTTSKDRSSRGLSRPSAGARLGRGEVVVEPDVGLLQLAAAGRRSRGRRRSSAPSTPVGDPVAAPGDERVVEVEHDAGVVCSDEPGEQLGGGVDLGEPVELVAGDVEQQRVGGLDLRGEPQGVRLVELEHGHVGVAGGRSAGSRRASRR